ncbi:S41 family peptidase [Anaerostipes sp.]|uniref:S41 family peptidase n=1 Tax=Anaerostipes sp. TaxID=1872530 RepID=UPI0025C4AF7D|nr:S41 family peptidase [Anaerostipes sp.]MBS7009361.1 S41 family peptidase [Anaerostipes sp.]
MKKQLSKIIIAVLLAVSLGEGFLLYRAYSVSGDHLEVAEKLDRLEKTVDQYYTGKVDRKKLEDYTYKGYLAGLGDPYSAYYSESEFKELMEATEGVFSGVGIYLSQDTVTGTIKVVKVIKGGPSDGKGIKSGDILVKVDGKSVSDKDLDKVVSEVKGEEGTKVKLSFLRGKEKDTRNFTITRKKVVTQTVETKMLDGGMGYLSISEFDEVTVGQFKEGIKKLKKQGMKGLIIDVRDNPGGLVDAVVDIADELLGKGRIVSIKDKQGKEKVYRSDASQSVEVPVCVLVNGNSASASEILSGALKDHKRGTLVGEKTFGKGIVQGFFKLGDGSYAKLTYASYYTPSGQNIHKKGIKPDVEVKDNSKTKADEQLRKAEQILRRQMDK